MLVNTNKFLEDSKRIHYKNVQKILNEFADIKALFNVFRFLLL
jgi:hypothetical protein